MSLGLITRGIINDFVSEITRTVFVSEIDFEVENMNIDSGVVSSEYEIELINEISVEIDQESIEVEVDNANS